MKRLFWLTALLLLVLSCEKSTAPLEEDIRTGDELSHEMIVLGEKLQDPYSYGNMTKALGSLYPTKANRIDITPTDVYVRFLPANDKEFERLQSLGISLMDHPLDYRIVRDGDYYHDPSIAEDNITWQYAVLPHGFKIPDDIRHEVLDDCYIPENDPSTRSADIDWTAVEKESFRLTGNSTLFPVETRSGGGRPKGRVTIVDDDIAEGKPIGVSGVKVVCNTFVKFSSCYTDRDGYYEINKNYSSNPRYRLLFHNEKGFDIGFNKLLVPASTSTLGKGEPTGIDAVITSKSDRKLYTRCVVNNATYDYIMRCSEDDMNVTPPPSNLRIWIFQKLEVSSAVMMRHGAFIDNSLITKFLGQYAPLLKLFLPDITLGLHDVEDYRTIYSKTFHELAHASHFAQVGKSFWDNYIEYIIGSFVDSGGETYGTGTGDNAGYCAVGEMWAYFMQSKGYHDRYGGSMPTSGTSYWFHPQILRYLYERGMSSGDIFKAFTKEVTSVEELRKKLIELYPDNKAMIEQVFTRYSE